MSGPETESSFPTYAPGTLLGGKFRVVKLLGAGGMGAVYEIEHEITKHRRALKMLHSDVQRYPHVVARFLREASAAGRVGNPHIIETFDAGTLENTGDPYLVMELLQGETISDVISHKQQLGLAEIVDLIGQACDGVEAAHNAGIVHRDLKPENLFVITQNGAPFVKILDFGVSKFDPTTTGSLSLTAEGSAIGTPFYMPPEQVRGGKDIDLRADIYALGVILYEAATGRKPFQADTLPHLALLIHEGKFEPIARSRPDLPPEFSQVVECAMAGDRDARFPSARSLREALAMLEVDASSAAMLGATTPALEAPVPSRAAAPSMPLTRRPITSAEAMSTPPPPSTQVTRQASATSAAMSLGVTAGSPQELPATPAKKGNGLGIGIGAGVFAIAAIGVAFFVGTRAPKSGIEPTTAAASSASPSTSSSATGDTPVVTPVTSATLPPSAVPVPLPATPTPSLPAAPPAHGGHASAPPTPPTPPPQPPATTPNTRADQKGLAKDNPFK